MTRRAESPVTPEQLALAWRHMRRPASWPGTLDAAMQDPRCAPCITGYARSMARAPFRTPDARPAHSLPAAPVPPTPTRPPNRQQDRSAANATARRHGPTWDARKAAANDLED